MNYKTKQEEFWAGEFGTEYIARNESDHYLASNISFFTKALRRSGDISSLTEFGANIGMNLRAIKLLYPDIRLNAVEINKEAASQLEDVIGKRNVFQGSILDYEAEDLSDIVLAKGVLIHINPEILDDVYTVLYNTSSRYILVCEYYNPTPVTITYRGHENRLFKRDFAGELLDKYSDLRLIDYGFSYHRDPSFTQDDISWFLLEKSR